MIAWLGRKLASLIQPFLVTAADGSIKATPPPDKKMGKITDNMLAEAGVGQSLLTPPPAIATRVNPYQMPNLLMGVLPKNIPKPTMAMDDAAQPKYSGMNYLGSVLSEGLGFMGYPYLSELTQRAEYRRPAETLAKEMTRKWIRLTATGDEDKTERVEALKKALEKYNVQDVIRQVVEQDSYFGRSQIYIDTGDTDERDERMKPLAISKAKLGKGSLKGFTVIEPIWTYPNQYESLDPLKPDFYKPKSWFVMGKEVHASRLLTFVFRPVPDLLKPAYAFGGLSLSQMAKPYVDNWLRTRQSVSDLVNAFSIMVLATDMSENTMQGGAKLFFKRLEMFTKNRNNSGVFAIDKTNEELTNVAVPLSGLSDLQAQAQEHMSAVYGIPLVVLLGITPKGLNASSEGEIRIYYDWIHAQQEANLDPHLKTIMDIVQISEFGDIDEDITYEWGPLWNMDETELATARKTEADTDVALIQEGVIHPIEARQRLASQPNSPYAGLDVDDVPPEPDMGEEALSNSDNLED